MSPINCRIEHMLVFVPAEREGDCSLHLCDVENMHLVISPKLVVRPTNHQKQGISHISKEHITKLQLLVLTH